MKLRMLLAICLFVLLVVSSVQYLSPISTLLVAAQTPVREWSKTFDELGITGYATAGSIVQTSDGGYAVTLGTYQSGHGGCLLVKLDSECNLQWKQTFAEQYTIGAATIVQTTDGGYALAGFTTYYPEDNITRLIWFAKTDSQGNTQWTKTYGDTSTVSEGRSMIQTSDGGYAIAGNYGSSNTEGWDALFIKIDSAGNLQWSKTFSNGPNDERFYAIVQTSDGGYVLAGSTGSTGNISHFWLVKTDSSGVMEWHQIYQGSSSGAGDWPRSLIQTNDGGYALTGYIDGGYAADYTTLGSFWLVKTDAEGSMQWNKVIGSYSHGATDVIQTSDGGYALSGYAESRTPGSLGVGTPFQLAKTDSSGNLQWTYGDGSTSTLTADYRGILHLTYGNGSTIAFAVIQTRDGGYVLASNTLEQSRKFWLTKFVSNEEPPTDTQTPATSPTPTPEPTPEQTQTPTPSQEPTQTLTFETILSVIIVVAIIGVVSGLLTYRIKRK